MKRVKCDPPQDFNAKGESTRRTRFHFKTKEFILTRLSTLAILPQSLAISFVSEHTLETIKREQVEQKSVLKFSNKSSVRKSTTRFQCAQKHARRVIYKLNKFPLQKGTVNDYERHPFLVTIEKEKVIPQRSQR